MLEDVIIYKNSCFYKKERKTDDNYFKIGYYDKLSNTCLVSSIGKGRLTTEKLLKKKLDKIIGQQMELIPDVETNQDAFYNIVEMIDYDD